MMTSTGLRHLADKLERMERLARPGSADDLHRLLIVQIGFNAGWAEGLRDFDTIPGSARLKLNAASVALECAADIVQASSRKRRR